MNRKTALAALLFVMLVATAFIVWDVAALGTADESLSGSACAYTSQPPCPTTFDCGYRFDDGCCIPRCSGKFCFGICFAQETLTPSRLSPGEP